MPKLGDKLNGTSNASNAWSYQSTTDQLSDLAERSSQTRLEVQLTSKSASVGSLASAGPRNQQRARIFCSFTT